MTVERTKKFILNLLAHHNGVLPQKTVYQQAAALGHFGAAIKDLIESGEVEEVGPLHFRLVERPRRVPVKPL